MAVNGIGIVLVQPLMGAWLGRRDASRVLAAGMAWWAWVRRSPRSPRRRGVRRDACSVWTLGEILFAAVSSAIIADLAPPHLRGRYGGLYGMAFSLASLSARRRGSGLLGLASWSPWLVCAVHAPPAPAPSHSARPYAADTRGSRLPLPRKEGATECLIIP